MELWSGFYDSKGTKIYEGDIVKYDSRTNTLVVVFERSTFYIVDTSIEKDLQVDCGTRLQGIYDNRSNGYTNQKLECLQVLGNIHENAELLKGVEMSKAAIIAISIAFITLIGFISTLSVWNYTQGKEIAKLKSELANASTLLQAQNAQILQDKLDLQAYQAKAQEIRERVITRYVNTSTQDKACEAQLSAIKQAVQVFYKR